MAWTYTYDKAVNATVFTMRVLIRDNNLAFTGQTDRKSESCLFCDEELLELYSLASNDIWDAAILALSSMRADKNAMLTAIKSMNYSENYKVEIDALIDQYKKNSASEAPAELYLETALTYESLLEYEGRGELDTIDQDEL